MIAAARQNILLLLVIGAGFLLTSLGVFAQSRSQPGGHLKLSVHNGTGSGELYKASQKVPVRATPPDGFTFVKWFQTNGDGKFTDPSATGTDFTMGTKDATVVATFVKLETWFPPGPEGTTKGLLLPSSRQASRLEQRIRVTVNRGSSSSTPQFSEIWKALSVRIKWQAATHVRFFTSQRGGTEVKSNTIVPSTSFQPKSEGIYEASLWYEGNLTHEQIAQMNPEVKIQLNIAVEGKDKPTSANGSLMPVQLVSISVTGETKPAESFATDAGQGLMLRASAQLRGSFKVPAEFRSRFSGRLVQNIHSTRVMTYTTPPPTAYATRSGGMVFDGSTEEGDVDIAPDGVITVQFDDVPIQWVPTGPVKACEVDDKFMLYLQYRFNQGPWTTLGKCNWTFRATSAFNSNQGWSGSATTSSATGSSFSDAPKFAPPKWPDDFPWSNE
jgi:hypothetical protein